MSISDQLKKISVELKSELYNNIKIGNRYKSFKILQYKYSLDVEFCQDILDGIEIEGDSKIDKDKKEVIKNTLKHFYDENIEYLNLNLPFENWDYGKILFS